MASVMMLVIGVLLILGKISYDVFLVVKGAYWLCATEKRMFS